MWRLRWTRWATLPLPSHRFSQYTLRKGINHCRQIPKSELKRSAIHSTSKTPPETPEQLSTPKQWTNHHYVPTNPPQRMFLAFGSAILGFLNPERADLVATLGETTGGPALARLKSKMEETHEGRGILKDKPRINSESVPISDLLKLPNNTFGYAYAKFMSSHGYSPDERPPVRHIENNELAYVMQRYREVHDFWHVLCGAPTTVEGEIGQKAFEFLQTGLPMALLSSAVGPLRLSHEERLRMLSGYLPWAYACNTNCTFLMGIRYENYLSEDLSDLRQQLGIIPVSEYVAVSDKKHEKIL
ncbi:hypothetical protein AAMO2058_000779500 [Amorphochlora amoebiformis]